MKRTRVCCGCYTCWRGHATRCKKAWTYPVRWELFSLCEALQADVETLDLAIEHDLGLLGQTQFLRLQDLALIITIVHGLGKGFFLWILDMAAVAPDPLLKLGVSLLDLIFEGLDLEVFGLDLFHEMCDFCGDVRDWESIS